MAVDRSMAELEGFLTARADHLLRTAVPVPAGFRKVTFPQAGTPILRLLPVSLLPKPALLCPPPSSAGPACDFKTSAPRGFPAPAFNRPPGY